MRQARIGGLHGGHHCIDHLALDAVGEMARIGKIGKAMPAVGDLLVLGERVGDEREDAQVFLQRRAHRFGGGTPDGLVPVLHLRRHLFERQFLSVHPEAQAGDGLVEQPVPRTASGDGFLVEKLLDPVLELMRLFAADVLEPGPVVSERLHRHGGIKHAIVDTVEFQREEQQIDRAGGDALLRIAVELGARRVGDIAGMDEAGIADHAAEPVLDPLVALQGGIKREAGVAGARHLVQLAAIESPRMPCIRSRPR